MRNFARINNYHNRIAAEKDFDAMAEFAAGIGHAELAEQHRPPQPSGWRKIDKHLRKLRGALEAEGFEVPPNPSSV